jgi:hypothetical protein
MYNNNPYGRTFTPTQTFSKQKFNSQNFLIPSFDLMSNNNPVQHKNFNAGPSFDLMGDPSNKFIRSFDKKLSVKSFHSSDSDGSLYDMNCYINTSGSGLSNNCQENNKRKPEKKKSLFNRKESGNSQFNPEKYESLEKFIDELGMELHHYICSQKGSR